MVTVNYFDSVSVQGNTVYRINPISIYIVNFRQPISVAGDHRTLEDDVFLEIDGVDNN